MSSKCDVLKQMNPIVFFRAAPFEFYDPASPIYTSPRFLPPAKIEENCEVKEAIISHGCTVQSSNISNAVVGLRSHIAEGCTLQVRSRNAVL